MAVSVLENCVRASSIPASHSALLSLIRDNVIEQPAEICIGEKCWPVLKYHQN